MAKAKDYFKYVEWSDEDKTYVGYAPELFLGGVCHGKKEAKVYNKLLEHVDEAIAEFRVIGKELPGPELSRTFSGKFNLRVGADVHKRLAIKARTLGKSLNGFCADILKESALSH